MKIFLSTNLASRFLIEQARSRLRRMGHEILSPWLERDPLLECDPDAPAKSPATHAREAAEDRAAILAAEAMVYLPGDDEGAIQFGMALAACKRVFFIGAGGPSYAHLPTVTLCADVYDFYLRLNAPPSRAPSDNRRAIRMPSGCLFFSPETFSQIVGVSARVFHVTPADVLSSSKKSRTVLARFAVIVAAGKYLRQANGYPPSQPALGRAMKRNHTTIFSAQKRAATMQLDFPPFATAMSAINHEIEQLIATAQAENRREAENEPLNEGAKQMGTTFPCAVAASGDRVAVPA
jgi:hypothetical protein